MTSTHHPARALSVLLGAMFLGNVDVAIANVAGPSIQTGLAVSDGGLELIISGYTLAYAALLVTFARLGEAHGYRKMFLTGLAAFTAASLMCGLAPDASTLVIARMVAGAAAALMTAQVLTGIQLGFTGQTRVRALGLYSLVLSAGAVAGQSLGGLLVSADLWGMSWRPGFLVNVPVGLVLLRWGWVHLPASHRRRVRPDLAGMGLLSAALILLVLPLVLGQDSGWPTWTWASLAISAVTLAAFWSVERQMSARGYQPLIDPQLITRPEIAWGLAAQAVATATYFAILFTRALFLQQGLGRSAAYSGLALVSWVVAFGIPGPVLGRLSVRARVLAAPIGALVLAAGFAGLATALYSGVTSAALFVPLLGLAGLGLGTSFTGTLSHLTTSVTAEHAAGISGLFNTISRTGGVLGTAVFGSFYLALVHSPGEAVHGFAVVNVTLAASALGAALLAALAIRHHLPARANDVAALDPSTT